MDTRGRCNILSKLYWHSVLCIEKMIVHPSKSGNLLIKIHNTAFDTLSVLAK